MTALRRRPFCRTCGVAAKQLQEGILNFLNLAFHREQVDAVNAAEKNLLADIKLGIILALQP